MASLAVAALAVLENHLRGGLARGPTMAALAAECDNRRVEIAAGRLIAFFSFDVGYEIDLERLRRELPSGARPGLGGGRKLAPAHVHYATPPLVLPAEPRRLVVAGRVFEVETTLRIHQFGAVTVAFEAPLDGEPCATLPTLTAALASGSSGEAEARDVLRAEFPRVAAAVSRANPDGYGLVEDYYVLQVSRFAPAVDAAELLTTHRDLVARTLHGEPSRLCAAETDDVLRTAVAYGPDDLVVTDWNVALVYDEDYEATLNVLELLNVQLLELRFLDTMLDRRIEALYERVERTRQRFSLRRSFVRLHELSELRLDTAALRERMINALKLIGDIYLTKVYARTAERLQIGAWQRSVDGKLEVIQTISDVFTGWAATARAELLELTIIILIAVEIALFFVV